MSTNLSDIPKRPDDVCKEANLNVDKSIAYLMFDMMSKDGYLKRPKDNEAYYIIIYKGVIFLKEGGYKRQKYLADRQKLASWFSDYFDIIIKPLTVISLSVGIIWATIQIIDKLSMCCH